MATLPQIAANRANAQLSSGPRSDEGKAASRFNALKHGLDAKSMVIPGENPADLEALASRYFDELCPQGIVETTLVLTLIRSDWLRNRYTNLESKVLARLIVTMDDPEATDADAFILDARSKNVLGKAFRFRQAAQRDWDRAYAEFCRLKKARLEAEPEPASAPADAPRPSSEAVAPLACVENRLRSENSPDIR